MLENMRKTELKYEVYNHKRIRDIEGDIIKIFSKYDATEIEALVCLQSLTQIISEQSGIIPDTIKDIKVNKN